MNDNRLYGLGVFPSQRPKPYADRFDFAEEISFNFENKLRELGKRIDSGEYMVAKTDLRFFRSNVLARLRVAARYGTIHRRDFLHLAKDVVFRTRDLEDEISHAMSNPQPLVID